MRHNPKHHWEEPKERNLKALKEKVNKEKRSKSSFLIVYACNSHQEWLILSFGINSNMFKLLCIEVLFMYNIQLLINGWYYHLILKA